MKNASFYRRMLEKPHIFQEKTIQKTEKVYPDMAILQSNSVIGAYLHWME